MAAGPQRAHDCVERGLLIRIQFQMIFGDVRLGGRRVAAHPLSVGRY